MLLLPLLLITTSAEARPATKAERAAIVEWFKTNLKDPYDLRSTRIAEPAAVVTDRGRRMEAICVEFNPRNNGSYVGIIRTPIEFTPAGLRNQEWDAGIYSSAACKRPDLVWSDFPELGRIR
ncbi:hypothetical protein [Methylobacterium oxalidis]|uniref:hypothetical protein n=1 Tax=Methylobacterium oxalidis TaxID=944322 RepID=UPI0033160956